MQDIGIIQGGEYGFSFSKGVFTDREGGQYHGFVCNPPQVLAERGALVIRVWRRIGGSASMPTILNVRMDEPYRGPPPAEEVAFD